MPLNLLTIGEIQWKKIGNLVDKMMKRTFDIIVSFISIIILLPLFLLIALSVAFDSKGGIFYKQIRVGKNNIDFKLLKFRTMRINSDQKGLLTIGSHDSRITPVGKFLRHYKLDELPQLINIFKGEMSIVGPRPEVRKYVMMYNTEQLQVLSVRPGLTDYASIHYINENDILAQSENPEKVYIEKIMPHKLSLNIEYIKKQSFIEDITIIFKTIAAIF